MSNKKKNNSPKTDKKETTNFAVNDRRFWNEDSDAEDTKQSRSKKPSFVEQLEKQLQDKEQKITELGVAIRAQKEEQRKIVERIERQKHADVLGMKSAFLEPLLDIVDNFELALKSLSESKNGSLDDAITGINMIFQQFTKTLSDCGVTKINTIGETFNPDISEAVAMKETDDPKQDNMVIDEYRSGFMVEDRLIRPARVTVGQYKEKSNNANEHAGSKR